MQIPIVCIRLPTENSYCEYKGYYGNWVTHHKYSKDRNNAKSVGRITSGFIYEWLGKFKNRVRSS